MSILRGGLHRKLFPRRSKTGMFLYEPTGRYLRRSWKQLAMRAAALQRTALRFLVAKALTPSTALNNCNPLKLRNHPNFAPSHTS